MVLNIIFLGYWATPQQLLRGYFDNDTPNNDSRWNNLQGTTDINKADYYVMFDCGHPKYPCNKLDPSKMIYIQLEPPGCVKQWMKKIKLPLQKYFFSGTHDNIHIPAFTNYICKPYTFLKQNQYIPRNKKLVVICSGKKYTPNHVKRIQFLEFLAQKKVPMDVYGKGLKSNKLSACYKGEWKPKSKFGLLSQYKYSIVLENYIRNNHMTEKLYDSFLSLTFPIYHGCTNMEKYFDKDSYQYINIEKPHDCYTKITQLLENDITPAQIIALKDSRDRVQNKYTIWPTIEKIINEHA